VAASENSNRLIKELCSNQDYKISEDGKITTLIQRTGKRSAKGYWREMSVKVSEEGYLGYRYKYKYLQAHRIVYQKFVGDLKIDLEINHLDGNPSNNHYLNLEQVSKSENQFHAFKYLNRKPAYSNAKINLDIAKDIRLLRKEGNKIQKIADLFGLSKSSISGIINNKSWHKNEVV
jgi:hypothetical protein